MVARLEPPVRYWQLGWSLQDDGDSNRNSSARSRRPRPPRRQRAVHTARQGSPFTTLLTKQPTKSASLLVQSRQEERWTAGPGTVRVSGIRKKNASHTSPTASAPEKSSTSTETGPARTTSSLYVGSYPYYVRGSAGVLRPMLIPWERWVSHITINGQGSKRGLFLVTFYGYDPLEVDNKRDLLHSVVNPPAVRSQRGAAGGPTSNGTRPAGQYSSVAVQAWEHQPALLGLHRQHHVSVQPRISWHWALRYLQLQRDWTRQCGGIEQQQPRAPHPEREARTVPHNAQHAPRMRPAQRVQPKKTKATDRGMAAQAAQAALHSHCTAAVCR